MDARRCMGDRLLLGAALVGWLAGCSASGGGLDPQGKEARADAEALKGDCARQDACDDAPGDSALVQLGLERFYEVGQRWTIVWIDRTPDQIHREAVQQLGGATFSRPRLVDFEVTEVAEARFGGVRRPVATLAIQERVEVPSTLQRWVEPAFLLREERLEVRVNNLFNPVSKTYHQFDAFGRPQQRTVELDGRSTLTMQFDALPNGYPDLDRIRPARRCDAAFFERLFAPEGRPHTACWDRAPQLPETLQEIAEAAAVDLRTPGLHIGPTERHPDYVFWQAGRPYPTLVVGPRGMGLLVEVEAR